MARDYTASVRSSRPSLSSELDAALGEEIEQRTTAAAFLVGLGGRNAGKLFRLRQGESVLGRSSKAFLTLDEKAVSHQHARVLLDDRGCFIEDLDSTNGTYVNEARVEAPVLLNAGDVIKIGNSVFGFLTDSEDEQQHTRALARMTNPQLSAHTLASSLPPKGIVQVPQEETSHSPGNIVRSEGSAVGLSRASADAPAEVGQLDKILDLLELGFRFARQNWKLLLVGSVLGACAGVYSIFLVPPISEASAELYLRQESTGQGRLNFASREVEFFRVAERTFIGEELVRDSLEKMNQGTHPQVVRGTARGLALSPVGRMTFEATFGHTDQKFAEEFLGTHLRNFLEHEINNSLSVLNSEVELLRDRHEQSQVRLTELEQELRVFKQDNLDALPEAAAGQVGARAQLLVQRDQLTANLDRFQKELRLARQQLSSEDALLESKVAQSAPYESALTQVKQKLAQARAKGYKDEHPEIRTLLGEQERLERLRSQTVQSATTETERRANPAHKALQQQVGRLEVSVSSTQTELGLVQQRLNEIDELAGALPAVEAGMTERLRKVAAAESLESRLFEQLKSKELELQLERASVAALYEVISPPHAYKVNMTSVGVKRGGAGLVGGFLLGVVLALLSSILAYSRKRKRLNSAAGSSE